MDVRRAFLSGGSGARRGTAIAPPAPNPSLAWEKVGAAGSIAVEDGVLTLTSGSGQAVTAGAVVDLDLSGGRYLSLKVASLDANLSTIVLTVSVLDASFNQAFTLTGGQDIDRTGAGGLINHAGEPQRLTFGAANWSVSSGTPTLSDLANVKAIRVTVTPNSGATAEVTVQDVQTHAAHANLHAAAILIFDDTRYPETYSVAFPLLQAHGVRGCISVESDRVGASTITLAQLEEMYAAGWDMLPHGKWGDSLLGYDSAGKLAQMQGSFDYLVTNGFTRSHKHFVLPGGQHDAEVWNLAKTVGFRTMRIADKQRFETLDAQPELTLVRAIQATHGQDISLHYGLADTLAERGGLGLWLFHRILDTDQTSTSSLDFTRENLDLLLARLAENDIPVVTPEEVWGN